MNRRNIQVGFSQRIRLEWFEQTTQLILAGNGRVAVKDSLQKLLQERVSVGSDAVRGNRGKVISILMNTWLTVPVGLEPLRDEGLNLLREMNGNDRIALHWGMASAVYPFWSVVAAYTGRLLRLQGVAAASQVQRRVRERYGDRQTASRAARRVLRSFIDWGVLEDTRHSGVYGPGKRYPIRDPRHVAWMVEASLPAQANRFVPMKYLIESPSLFPFRISRMATEHVVSFSPRLEILRQGLDDELVTLSEAGSSQGKGEAQSGSTWDGAE